MKKLIFFLLLSFSANADLYVKQIATQQGKGFIFSYVERGVNHCWIMPEWVDLNYFDISWLTVNDTAIFHNWPASDPEAVTACANGPKVFKVATGKMYTITGSLKVVVVMNIPNGIPCGDAIHDYSMLRSVTYGGHTGFAVCF